MNDLGKNSVVLGKNLTATIDNQLIIDVADIGIIKTVMSDDEAFIVKQVLVRAYNELLAKDI